MLKSNKAKAIIAAIVAVAVIAAIIIAFNVINAPKPTENPVPETNTNAPIVMPEANDQAKAEFVEKYRAEQVGGVATVLDDGTEISNKENSDKINQMRAQLNLIDETDWNNWLSQKGFTVESLRQDEITRITQEHKFDRMLADNGLSVDEEEINKLYNDFRATFQDDESYNKYLFDNALTDEEVRTKMKLQQAQAELVAIQQVDENIPDEEIIAYCNRAGTVFDNPVPGHEVKSISDLTEENVNAIRERLINSRKLDKFLAQLNEQSLDTQN